MLVDPCLRNWWVNPFTVAMSVTLHMKEKLGTLPIPSDLNNFIPNFQVKLILNPHLVAYTLN